MVAVGSLCHYCVLYKPVYTLGVTTVDSRGQMGSFEAQWPVFHKRLFNTINPRTTQMKFTNLKMFIFCCLSLFQDVWISTFGSHQECCLLDCSGLNPILTKLTSKPECIIVHTLQSVSFSLTFLHFSRSLNALTGIEK